MDSSTSTVRLFEKVCNIIDKFEREPAKLIAILQEVQKEYRYLPEEVLAYIATSLEIPPARVYGVATFYENFTLEPQGKHIIKICDGTACHVKQSIPVLEALQKKLNLSKNKKTTTDMLFTLETVSCLGACGLAPVVVIDEDVHGQVTPEKAVEIIEKIIEQEACK